MFKDSSATLPIKKRDDWSKPIMNIFKKSWFFCEPLLTQLHWGACLVNRMLTGAQAVLQLGGGSLWRGGGTDSADRVGRVDQWGGGTGRRGPRGAWGRRVGDFTPHLTAPASSSSTHWAGQTWAPGSTNSEWSPAERRKETDTVCLSLKVSNDWRWYWFLLRSCVNISHSVLETFSCKTGGGFLFVLHFGLEYFSSCWMDYHNIWTNINGAQRMHCNDSVDPYLSSSATWRWWVKCLNTIGWITIKKEVYIFAHRASY